MSPRTEREPWGGSHSLTLRLGLALALVFVVGGLALAIAALAYGRNAAQQSFDRLLLGAAQQIAEAVALREGEVVADLPVSAFELLSLAPDDRVFYAIHDNQGRLVTGYDLPRPAESGDEFYKVEVRGEPIRVARVTRNFSERRYVGSVEVLVGQTTRARGQLALQIARNAMIFAAIAGFAMAGLAIFAVRSALGPLRRIESDIGSRAVDDMTPIDVAIPREIASLVAALNRFMRRIDRQIGVMRNLIADASHQLRTPIAALRAQAELAQEETDPDRLRAILNRIHMRSQSLSRLTDQLLNHALIIHRADSVRLERVDLRKVAIRAMEETDHANFAAPERPQLDLPEEPVWCRADPLSLVEACKNLLGNALRHGKKPVTLAVMEDATSLRLAVRDAGPGIPEKHWADAGTRYSRSSGVSPESASLGLAIVQAVAKAHLGRLEFSHSGDFFQAALVLPKENGGQI